MFAVSQIHAFSAQIWIGPFVVMGGCATRMKREMEAPPPRSANWEGLSPQRPVQYIPDEKPRSGKENESNGSNGAPLRRETESGIPGLTYDQAGRPV